MSVEKTEATDIVGFSSYDGEEPYIFVSYSHKDITELAPILNALYCAGYNVCYDEGILPGEDWPDWIANHVSRCKVFLAFISEASSESRHCKAEMFQAISDKRHIIQVYLSKKANLSKGLQMYVRIIQGLTYNGNPDKLLERLEKNKKFSECKVKAASSFSPSTVFTASDSRSSSKLARYMPFLAVVLLLVCMFIIFWFTRKPYKLTEDGVLYIIKEEPHLIDQLTWEERDSVNKVSINFGITTIYPEMFEGFTNLRDIDIPHSVKSIGDGAFAHCTDLPRIEIPSSVEFIGAGAFQYCTALPSIVIPDSVTIIGKSAFSHCESLTTITMSKEVSEIGENTFEYCYSLNGFEISDRVERIGEHAFFMCEMLPDITIPGNVRIIERDAFRHCSGLTEIEIQGIETLIGQGAFKECQNLNPQKVKVPDEMIQRYEDEILKGIFDSKVADRILFDVINHFDY